MTENTEDQLLKAFELVDPKYIKVKVLDKPLIGISLIINHDKKYLIKNKLDDNYVCLMRIFLNENWKETNEQFKKVVGVANFTIDNNTGTFPMLDFSKGLGAWAPIELNSENEYFLDSKNKKFFKRCPRCSSYEEMSLSKIADDLFFQHLKPTRPFTGMFLRNKLRLSRSLNWITLQIAKLIAFIYFSIFGEKVGYDFFSEYSLKHFDKNTDIVLKNAKKINIFGYEATIQLIFFFCLFHLLAYAITTYLKIGLPAYLKRIFESNFLTLVYAIVTLYILEQYIKPLFKRLLLWLLSTARRMNEIVSSINIQI